MFGLDVFFYVKRKISQITRNKCPYYIIKCSLAHLLGSVIQDPPLHTLDSPI